MPAEGVNTSSHCSDAKRVADRPIRRNCDDVEHLLPPGQRNPESVKRFMGRMKARYGHLGFNQMATATGTDPVLTMSLIQSKGPTD